MIGGMDHNLLVVHTGNTLLKSALLGYTREHEWFYSLHSTLSTPAILDGDSTVSLMTISAGAILLCLVSKEYLLALIMPILVMM